MKPASHVFVWQAQSRCFVLAAVTSILCHFSVLFFLRGFGPAQIRIPEKSLQIRLVTPPQGPVSVPLLDPPIAAHRNRTVPGKSVSKHMKVEEIPPSRDTGKAGSQAVSRDVAGTDKKTEFDAAADKGATPNSAIDPDSIRRVTRQIAHETGAAEAQGRRPESTEEKKSPLVREVEKGDRGDCRTAYAGLGLLAVPFLLRDSVSESGCRWRP